MKEVSNGSSAEASRLLPASRWNKYHEWPSIGGMRHLLFHRETNGLARAVVTCGRRILIDERKFFDWLQRQSLGGRKHASR